MTTSKTIGDVYRERNLLATALAVDRNRRGERAGWSEPTDEDDADADEWAVIWIELPTGQVSWHVPRTLVEATDLERRPYQWDGHSRLEKNARIEQFTGW